MNKYRVRYLTAPVTMDLFHSEILDRAEEYPGLYVEEIGMSIVEVMVTARDQVSAHKAADRKMFNEWKGDRFELVAIRKEVA